MSLKICLLFCLCFVYSNQSKGKLTFSGKVLITTGFGLGNGQLSEIVDVKNPDNKCENLPDYPIQEDGANAGLIMDKYPLICGGSNVNINDCYYYDSDTGNWEFAVGMSQPRYRGGHVVVNKESLWVTGSINQDKTTTELITLNFPGGSAAPGINNRVS